MVRHKEWKRLKGEIGRKAAGPMAGSPGHCGSRVGGFNAKAQSREGATSFPLLCSAIRDGQTFSRGCSGRPSGWAHCPRQSQGNDSQGNGEMRFEDYSPDLHSPDFSPRFSILHPPGGCGWSRCAFAPLRLCVEKSALSVKSVKSAVQFLRLRLAARCSMCSLRFSSVRASAFPAIICGFLPKAATKQFFSISAFQLLPGELRLIKAN